jgi:hypothetical protein
MLRSKITFYYSLIKIDANRTIDALESVLALYREEKHYVVTRSLELFP